MDFNILPDNKRTIKIRLVWLLPCIKLDVNTDIDSTHDALYRSGFFTETNIQRIGTRIQIFDLEHNWIATYVGEEMSWGFPLLENLTTCLFFSI